MGSCERKAMPVIPITTKEEREKARKKYLSKNTKKWKIVKRILGELVAKHKNLFKGLNLKPLNPPLQPHLWEIYKNKDFNRPLPPLRKLGEDLGKKVFDELKEFEFEDVSWDWHGETAEQKYLSKKSSEQIKLYSLLPKKTGEKGGKKDKIRQPILLAITQYLLKNPKYINEKNNRIAKLLQGINEEKSEIVNYDGREWDFYFYENLFWAVPDAKNHTKHRVISRSITAIRKTYIKKAKEELIKETQKNK
jgi:hypothetical protein